MTQRELVVGVMLLGAIAPSRAAGQSTAEAYLAFLTARRLEADGEHARALAALQRAAEADPGSAEIRSEMAQFHLRRNARPEAEREAKAALELDADNVGANRVLGLLNAASVEGGAGRDTPAQTAAHVRDAIMYLERAIAGSPVTADVSLHYTLGRLYILNGEAQRAIESLTRVLSQNPGSVRGRLTIAQAYAAAKDLPNAIAVLEEIIEDEPGVAASLAQYQEQAGLLLEAAESYTRALTVQPGSRELKLRRVLVLLEAKQFDRAATFAAEGRRRHPDDSRFPRLQAQAMFDGGDRAGAVSLLEQIVKESPRDTGTLYSLADAYVDTGRPLEAERALRQIIAAEPGHANALNYLGYLLATRGERLDEAIDLVQRALREDPDNGAFLDSLGWAFFKRGDLDDAEKYLTAAAERLPENSEVQDHLGDLFARQGRFRDAVAAWTRALAGDGRDVDRAVIEGKIGEAKGRMQK
jgi:tetratricopeptide (TPR) repeat protein